MKFTDGQWLIQPGVLAHYAAQAHSIASSADQSVIHASVLPIKRVNGFPSTGEATAGPLLSPWPNRCVVAYPSACAVSVSGVTTLAGSKAPLLLPSTNGGPPSACSPRTAVCMAARVIAF